RRGFGRRVRVLGFFVGGGAVHAHALAAPDPPHKCHDPERSPDDFLRGRSAARSPTRAFRVAPASTRTLIRTNDDMISWKGGVVFKPRSNGSIYIGRGTSFNPSAEGLSVTA